MAVQALWGEEFKVNSSLNNKEILNKINSAKSVKVTVEKALKSKSISLDEKLELITENVYRILGTYKEQTILLKSISEMSDYLSHAKENGVIAIDTETNNSLDPVTCKLMGVCIYTPGLKNAYIPINHVNKDTRERLEWQLTEQDIFDYFSKLDDTTIICHSGKFDYKVLKCTTGWEMPISWDTMIVSKLLDENEWSHGLKQQYISKIDNSIEKYSIEGLFKDIEYAIIDPEIFALYAATDSYMTYKLYEYQKEFLNKSKLPGLFNLWETCEKPLITVLAEMELRGVYIDKEYTKKLLGKYKQNLDEVNKELDIKLKNLNGDIEKWKNSSDAQKIINKNKKKFEQLTDPINLNSPVQLSILLYDILKITPPDKNNPRGTAEDILLKINHPICELILKQRSLSKLITTFIQKIYDLSLESIDGRIRTGFNQLGARTGRLSSSDPINLQNIPARDDSIRSCFSASPGYVLFGLDYSQQEVMMFATLTQDEKMLNTLKAGKDFYADLASTIFNTPYEENLEFRPDGSYNLEGKTRRSIAKNIVLGVLYCKGARATAEDFKKSRKIEGKVTKEELEEAEDIINKFWKNYPKAKNFVDSSVNKAYSEGIAEGIFGYIRHLPDLLLNKYDFVYEDSEFNPLLNSSGNKECPEKYIDYYTSKLDNVKFRSDKDNIIEEAKNKGIKITSNESRIAKAYREIINSQVQGSAASLTKRAMVLIHNDPLLKSLGARLLISIHDEIQIEVPKENLEQAVKRASYLYLHAGGKYINIPLKTDADICPISYRGLSNWYKTSRTAHIKDSYLKIDNSISFKDKVNILLKEYEEYTEDEVLESLVFEGVDGIPDYIYNKYKDINNYKVDISDIINGGVYGDIVNY